MEKFLNAMDEHVEGLTRRDQLLGCFDENGKFMESVRNIPEEYMLKDETELSNLFRVTPLDYAMKKQLWQRFYEVEKTGIYKLKMTDIYGGLCSNPYFYQQFIQNPARVAWLLSPPLNTEALIEEAFRYSFQKVRDEILNMPITEKSAPVILKAFQYFADRHLGPMVQRIESKNLNVDVDARDVNVNGPVDPYEIEERLRELKKKLIPAKVVNNE